MHPFNVATDLDTFGFWYTYWSLRTNNCYTRAQALWLIWVAHNYAKHRNKLFDDSVRVLTK